MRADQRPHVVRVVGLIPVRIRRLVAAVTRGRKAGRAVIRIRGRIVVRQVAADAIGRRPGIDAPHVTGRAIERRVHSDKLECVGEVRVGPRRGLVAGLASGRETGRPVVRISGRVVIVEVAVDAVGRQPGIDAARVAVVAVEGGVHAGQRERVIEVRIPVR